MESSMMVDCNICQTPYDQFEHSPMILCKHQHVCCEDCAIMMQNLKPAKCPECRQVLSKGQVIRFRQYLDWLKQGQDCRAKLKKEKEKTASLSQITDSVRAILEFPFPNEKQFYSFAKEKAEKLFEEGKNHAAIVLLESLIERFPDFDDYPFIGLGSFQERQGFSQGRPLAWYKDRYKVQDLSAEDVLNHILMQTPSQQENGKDWYGWMSFDYPFNYKLAYGFALAKHNNRQQSALFNYKWVINLNPDFSKAYCMAAFMEKDKDQKIKLAKLCLQKEPNNIFAKYILAKCSQDKLSMLEDITREQQTYNRALREMGKYFYVKGKFAEAIQKLQVCLSLNQKYFAAVTGMAYSFVALKIPYKAIDHLKKSLEIQWTDTQKSCLLQILGTSYLKLKKYNEAIIFYKQSLNLNPKSAGSAVGLAGSYFKVKRYQFAVKMYERAHILIPLETIVFKGITKSYKALQKYNEAIKYYEKWKLIEPGNTEVDVGLGIIYLSLGQWNNALKHFLVCKGYDKQIRYCYIKIVKGCLNEKDYKTAAKYIKEHIPDFRLTLEQQNDIIANGETIPNIKRDQIK